MELDDLKLAFSDLERRVIDVEAALHRQRRSRRWSAVRRPLIALGLGQTLQTIFGILIVATIAPFWIAHRHEPAMLVSGLVVHAYGVAVVCSSVMQLLMIGRTYYTDAVVAFQQRVAELARVRVITGAIVGLPWWVLWILIPAVALKAGTGVDLFVEQPAWVFGSLAVGVVGMIATYTFARRLCRRPPASPWLRKLVEDASGESLKRVNRRLADLERFAGD